ncbi:MAG TPA: tryptophan 7-halogenase [Vicinamibacterales bacterium]|nr:tryptophan 7-halogenase [Vicinamibacterales bacterium]
MRPDVDLAIVGSGFGGSLLALVARRLGLRVALLERGRHPRFAIGESASPLAGVVLEQLADRYDLPRIRPLASYGPWRRTYPDVTCGLKRGFTFHRHDAGEPYVPSADRANELLVAASPHDEVADTHWLRADVDHFLVREAIAGGVEYSDDTDPDDLHIDNDGVVIDGAQRGRRLRLSASAVVDASGPRGFLSRALQLPSADFDGCPRTQALYSHFVGVRCLEGEDREVPPYPPDAAAVHHVFDGGWMWMLRFANGVTSAGVAVADAFAAELRLADGAPAWRRLLARFPSIAEQFADAEPIREFTWMPAVAWRSTRAAGERWAMLPSAAAFVDPLFSTGIPMTLLGVERIAAAIERGELVRGASLSGSPREPTGFAPRSSEWHREYEARTLREADHVARFIGGCYASFPHFASFTAFSMFYFAAASYSEMARRLDRPSRGFLCADDEAFVAAMRGCGAAAADGRLTLDAVACATERLNVAGLCDPSKRNWYGVDLDDVVRGAGKLGVSADAATRFVAETTERIHGADRGA